MTTSGNSAERKNRFTNPLSAQGTSEYEPHRSPVWVYLQRVGKQVLVEYADVGQVPVSLGEVEAVADDELVRDLEPNIPHRNVDFAARRLGQEGADLEGRRLTRFQVADQVGEGQAGVDDVLHHEHVAALDVDVEVFEDAHDPGGIGRVAVARDGHEVDLAGDGQVPHQVGHEEDRAF